MARLPGRAEDSRRTPTRESHRAESDSGEQGRDRVADRSKRVLRHCYLDLIARFPSQAAAGRAVGITDAGTMSRRTRGVTRVTMEMVLAMERATELEGAGDAARTFEAKGEG